MSRTYEDSVGVDQLPRSTPFRERFTRVLIERLNRMDIAGIVNEAHPVSFARGAPNSAKANTPHP
ncbi:hypothetical protein GC170_09260 [bacterium]|nr:hypothetical protein [bacterium]